MRGRTRVWLATKQEVEIHQDRAGEVEVGQAVKGGEDLGAQVGQTWCFRNPGATSF